MKIFKTLVSYGNLNSCHVTLHTDEETKISFHTSYDSVVKRLTY